MKSILGLAMLFMVFNATASIEHVASEQSQATPQEIAKSRACFEELAKQGCKDPGENLKSFRTCMHDSYSQLSESCQKMMTYLYKRKE